MSARTVIDCDRCGNEGATTFGPFDLGHGPETVDLDKACAGELNMGAIINLATDYGVAVDEPAKLDGKQIRKPRSETDYSCPFCTTVAQHTMRGNVLMHMANNHNLDYVEASHALPPMGESFACPMCNFLTTRIGFAQHRAAKHPNEAVA